MAKPKGILDDLADDTQVDDTQVEAQKDASSKPRMCYDRSSGVPVITYK